MCGIAGVVDSHGPVERAMLEHMTRALVLRGPDDEGFFTSDGGCEPWVGLGMRRLSVIDLDTGHQPIGNEDGSIQLVFNGEIYNFQELQHELRNRGHVLRTNSDTEVIAHLYEELGEACVEKLNGMFAIALWDAKARRLFLARDRFGEKPLYYFERDGRFVFASELKGLFRHPCFTRTLDPSALAKYLAYEFVPAPDTIFAGVRKLPAAHSLCWDRGAVSLKRYWRLPFSTPTRRREEEVAEELRARLTQAVRSRLVSDVPLGVFLSGGIDSSTIVALLSQSVPASSIQTFSVGFADRSFDESEPAERVARLFGTSHHLARFDASDLLDVLPTMADYLDEPLADASVLPTHLLCRSARPHITVALGGDAGDELFAGYPTFQAHAVAPPFALPAFLVNDLLRPALEWLPVSTDNFSFDFKLKQFAKGLAHPPAVRNQVWLGSFDQGEVRALLQDGDHAEGIYRSLVDDDRALSGGAVERAMHLTCRYYLQDDVLTKVDRTSMACSLEVRAPFLDHTLAEFVSALPLRFKLKRLRTKHILKQAMKGLLPPDILNRPKKGFGIPVARWLKGELRELMLDLLSADRLRAQGLFAPSSVARLVDDHLRGRRDNRKALWTLLMFQMWHERHAQARS